MGVEGHRRLRFVSGQVPVHADGTVPGGPEAQCEQAWRNVISVLAAARLGVEHIVKVSTFLTDRAQIAANRASRRRVLQGNEPASTVMIAQTLDSRWLLEIEAIAADRDGDDMRAAPADRHGLAMPASAL